MTVGKTYYECTIQLGDNCNVVSLVKWVVVDESPHYWLALTESAAAGHRSGAIRYPKKNMRKIHKTSGRGPQPTIGEAIASLALRLRWQIHHAEREIDASKKFLNYMQELVALSLDDLERNGQVEIPGGSSMGEECKK